MPERGRNDAREAAGHRRRLCGRGARGPSAVAAVARGQVDDGRGRQSGDEHDERDRPARQRAPLPAEERSERLAERSSSSEYTLKTWIGSGMFFSRTRPRSLYCRPPEPPGEPDGRLADEHLAAVRAAAEPRRDVERGTAEAAVLEPDRLARVDADADLARNLQLRLRWSSS